MTQLSGFPLPRVRRIQVLLRQPAEVFQLAEILLTENWGLGLLAHGGKSRYFKRRGPFYLIFAKPIDTQVG